MTSTAITLLAIPASILGLALYVFIGGLVVRLWNALPPFTGSIDEDNMVEAAIVWPFILVVLAAASIAGFCCLALRLSQWSPKRKSALPGARVVR